MSEKYYFQGSNYDRAARDKYYKEKINRAARKSGNWVLFTFFAFFGVFFVAFIPFLGFLLLIPIIISLFGGSMLALKYSKDVDKYVKEQKQELANQLEYYRDSVLDYGIFNVLAMFDEISVKQDERSVLAGIIIYFLHKGILKETSDGYRVASIPVNEQEADFLEFLLPNGFDTKDGIKERMTQAGNNVFQHIEPTLVKDGYLVPYEPNMDYINELNPNNFRKRLLNFMKNLQEKYKERHPELKNIDPNDNSGVIKYYKFSETGEKMANEIMGSYRFFKDFTIIDERSKIDFDLWDDYLVMATIYNMAEKVEIDLEDVMPDWRDFYYEQ